MLAAVCMTIGFTACGGGGDDGGGSKAYVEPKGASTETIAIEAQQLLFKPTRSPPNAGIATIKLTAAERASTTSCSTARTRASILEADGGGGSQSKKIDLKPGKYTFYCSITGHRAQGMEGTLTVK